MMCGWATYSAPLKVVVLYPCVGLVRLLMLVTQALVDVLMANCARCAVMNTSPSR